MSRICIFCQSESSSAGKGEHLFPEWLNTVFKDITNDPDIGHKSYWERNSLNFESGEITEKSWRKQEIASETTKLVCNTCNTGWMQCLENRARPLLVPMIKGDQQSLNQIQQLTAATWVTKTVMVIESVINKGKKFRQEHRTILREEDRPPGFIRISAAAITGQFPLLGYVRVTGKFTIRTGENIDMFIYTLHMGALIFQVARPEPPPSNYGALKTPTTVTDIEVSLFPPAQFSSPPKSFLNKDSFNGYAAGYRHHNI